MAKPKTRRRPTAKAKARRKTASPGAAHELRRSQLVETFRRAAVDLIELDAVPFAEFRTMAKARGETVMLVLSVEKAAGLEDL